MKAGTAARSLSSVLILLCFSLLAAGCPIQLVADYDSATFEEILKVGKKVDRFYGTLLETREGERDYKKFSEQYVDIETDIRGLVTRNEARALNRESTEISKTILSLWTKYKDAHRANNGYKDALAKLHRSRFSRLFTAAASAEEAKKLSSDEKDPSKDD